jgi:tRNA(Ile)-lysidine synthase
MPCLPVSHDEFARAMGALSPFEANPAIAVALSGGVDSMALALLAHRWAQQMHGRLVALTVDHGLRPESAGEAAQVRKYCNKLGIEHHILTWQPQGKPAAKPASAVQASARDARYQLLSEWCKAHDVLHLLTAHHQDDQSETLFFRLGRGSGLDGLACMSPVSVTHNVRILRPLLDVPKSHLEATLSAGGQGWVEDASNQKTVYTRNFLRKQLQETGRTQEINQQAANLASRLGTIRNHMENIAASYLTQAISLYPEGYAAIHMPAFKQLPREYGLKTLSALLATVGGHAYPLRSEQNQRLYDEIMQGGITRRTLGGLQIIWKEKPSRFLVCREANAVGQAVLLPPQTQTVWDSRFVVVHNYTDPLTVQPLGAERSAVVKKLLPKGYRLPERAIMCCLPAFWHLETLVSVPHIGYCHPDYRQAQCSVRFYPAKALAAPAFFSMNRVA